MVKLLCANKEDIKSGKRYITINKIFEKTLKSEK